LKKKELRPHRTKGIHKERMGLQGLFTVRKRGKAKQLISPRAEGKKRSKSPGRGVGSLSQYYVKKQSKRANG